MSKVNRTLECIRVTPHPNASDPSFESVAFQSETGITLALDIRDDELGSFSPGGEYELTLEPSKAQKELDKERVKRAEAKAKGKHHGPDPEPDEPEPDEPEPDEPEG